MAGKNMGMRHFEGEKCDEKMQQTPWSCVDQHVREGSSGKVNEHAPGSVILCTLNVQ